MSSGGGSGTGLVDLRLTRNINTRNLEASLVQATA